VAVVGGGQAGLAASRELSERGIAHVILERGRIAQTWRDRWDSFCLVTPNWSISLPGGAYDGPDPDGYLRRDELVAHLEGYAKAVGAPVREGVEVLGIDSVDGGFVLRTSTGELAASRLVLATGAYQRPYRPPAAGTLPARVLQVDVEGYSSPQALPPGRVLVVGSGQSGCQIAEELLESGREVVLSCGRAPWTHRRYGGRDVFWWSVQTGFLDQPIGALPDPSARLWANLIASGHHGGRDLHLRGLRAAGVTLAGRFAGRTERVLRFAPDLAASVEWGDRMYLRMRDLMLETARRQSVQAPEVPDPEPFDPAAPDELDLSGLGAVIFAGGFRPDYRSWLPWPDAFDEVGFPIHREGASTVVPGLFFVGVHFLRTRKSSLLYGVGEDAAIVADSIASWPRGSRPPAAS
jgi:putative flavoprotein involved in K+ transport